MNTNKANSFDPALRNLDALLPDLAELYKDVHSHPELSMQETRTGKLAAGANRGAFGRRKLRRGSPCLRSVPGFGQRRVGNSPEP